MRVTLAPNVAGAVVDALPPYRVVVASLVGACDTRGVNTSITVANDGASSTAFAVTVSAATLSLSLSLLSSLSRRAIKKQADFLTRSQCANTHAPNFHTHTTHTINALPSKKTVNRSLRRESTKTVIFYFWFFLVRENAPIVK